ncbi:hypothetical protein ACVBE9_08005 [Eionea flava]
MTRKISTLSNTLLSSLIIVLMLAYPFLVHRYIESVNPQWFAGILFTLFTLRFFILSSMNKNSDRILYSAVGVFCLIASIFESAQLLKFYPVLMSLGMSLMFIISLTDERCLIENLVRLSGKKPPSKASNYLRILTLLWGILLGINAIISAYTAWYASLSTWMLYNGFISYVLLACFATCEWFYRGHYKKTRNITDD